MSAYLINGMQCISMKDKTEHLRIVRCQKYVLSLYPVMSIANNEFQRLKNLSSKPEHSTH
jgi:hypothetical protein